jgi:hypothetical protein
MDFNQPTLTKFSCFYAISSRVRLSLLEIYKYKTIKEDKMKRVYLLLDRKPKKDELENLNKTLRRY